MKKVQLSEKVKIVGVQDSKKDAKKINYYIITEQKERLYAFTKRYTRTAYDLCKSGIRVNELLYYKSRHSDIMTLVSYTKRMMPYLIDY